MANPKAIKTLRITAPASRRARPTLMGIPPEIRNIIYEYALVEPSLHDKRHQPGCPFFHPEYAAETPPIAYHEARRISGQSWQSYLGIFIESDTWSDDGYDRCRKICLRRKGLGLLWVSRRIYEEASPIFWGQNTICLYRSKEALKIMEDPEYPRWVGKVQKLMVWGGELVRNDRVFPDEERSVFTLLRSMPSLKRVELPSDLLCYEWRLSSLMRLLRYVELRIWQFHKTIGDIRFVGNAHPWEEGWNGAPIKTYFYIGIHRDYRFTEEGKCPNHGVEDPCMCESIPETARIWCENRRLCCSAKLKSLEWWKAVEAELASTQKRRSQKGPGAHVVTVEVGAAKVQERVSIWGMPERNAKERRRAFIQAMLREAFEKKTSMSRRYPEQILDENGAEPDSSKADRRERCQVKANVPDRRMATGQGAERHSRGPSVTIIRTATRDKERDEEGKEENDEEGEKPMQRRSQKYRRQVQEQLVDKKLLLNERCVLRERQAATVMAQEKAKSKQVRIKGEVERVAMKKQARTRIER